MAATNRSEAPFRVLVCVPTPADAAILTPIVSQAGGEPGVVSEVDTLAREAITADTVVVSEEMLGVNGLDQLADALEAQPEWSDIPVLLLTSSGTGSPLAHRALERLNKVLLFDRPVRITALEAGLRVSLRTRRRQRQVQQLLEERARLNRELAIQVEALRKSEEDRRARAAELEAILEAAPLGILVARDPETREIVGNRTAYELLRLPLGTNISKWAPGGQAPAYPRFMRGGKEIPLPDLPVHTAAATGRPVRDYEFQLVHADGTTTHLLGHAVPLFGEDGRPRGAIGAFIDITERKRTEERLRQTQKLESIGLLAGGIAHDFNNLLTGVLGNASLILDEVGPRPAERVRSIVNSAERAAHLTRQLLAYSGKGQFILQDITISQAANEIADLVRSSIPKTVDLVLALQSGLPTVRMDPSQLEQILMNLVINAGEAIGEGNRGTITVSTLMADLTEPFVDATGREVASGRYVSIEVRDTGSGMDEATRSRIFDPFFTTRFAGRGLGLAAVAGIVRARNGAITVESTPGRGSTFRVLLPVSPDRRQERPAAGGKPVGTILVVDDEPTVRDFICEVFERKGYRVLTASDGREALAVYDRERTELDAVILDIVMPVKGARETLPELEKRQPGIKVLLTSGFTARQAIQISAARPGTPFIQKPYTAQQLLEAMDSLLAK